MNQRQIDRLTILESLAVRQPSFEKTLFQFVKELQYTESSKKSALNFQVVGDGVTDNTEAIELACNNSDGFYLPSGTYLIGSDLTITKPI
jgi:polygalacturonase